MDKSQKDSTEWKEDTVWLHLHKALEKENIICDDKKQVSGYL